MQAVLDDFSPAETQKLHCLVLVHTSISTGSSNRESCCYKRIPGPSLDDHILDSKLDAWKVGEHALEPCSDSFYSCAFSSQRGGTGKGKRHLWMELAHHLLVIAHT